MIDRQLIEAIMQTRVSDVALYQQALLHKSIARSHGGRSYERLELLGDAVLNLVTAEFLLSLFPEAPEGVITRARIKLVNGTSCSRFATFLGLGEHISASENAVSLGVRHKRRVLEDAFEAWLGAVFIDLGIEGVRALLERIFGAHRELIDGLECDTNYKDMLLKHCQLQGIAPPVYTTVHSGPAHARTFETRVGLADVCGTGFGMAKKTSEMNAAEAVYVELQRRRKRPNDAAL